MERGKGVRSDCNDGSKLAKDGSEGQGRGRGGKTHRSSVLMWTNVELLEPGS